MNTKEFKDFHILKCYLWPGKNGISVDIYGEKNKIKQIGIQSCYKVALATHTLRIRSYSSKVSNYFQSGHGTLIIRA